MANESFADDVWDINWTSTSEQLSAYRLFYYALLIRQSEIYIFYEPLDDKFFILTDKMKADHERNMANLKAATESFEVLMLTYFTSHNPANSDINDPNANHIIESIDKTWTNTGINFGYLAGEFENFESHSTFVEGLDNSWQPKQRVYNRLPWNYKDWPVYYSYGMWGSIKLGDRIYFSKCMYKNIESGEIFYGARVLSTMCTHPLIRMLIMDRQMKQISFIDGMIIFIIIHRLR